MFIIFFDLSVYSREKIPVQAGSHLPQAFMSKSHFILYSERGERQPQTLVPLGSPGGWRRGRERSWCLWGTTDQHTCRPSFPSKARGKPFARWPVPLPGAPEDVRAAKGPRRPVLG